MSVENHSKVTCVFVHGWAMNSAVWEACLPLLPDWIEVIRVDLPGHGSMASVGANGINDYVQVLASVVHRPVIWVGWSLGGLAVLQLAWLYPERVAGLFLVASNPCFVRKPDWQAGVSEEVFGAFSASLEENVDATIKRFLALQVRGSATAMQTVRQLQQSLQQRGSADIEALRLGLDILSGSDFRRELSMLDKPVSWLLGARDALVPVALAEKLATLNPGINIIIDKEAAHAPFISHPQNFIDALVRFAGAFRAEHLDKT